jgi:hypothetical protein
VENPYEGGVRGIAEEGNTGDETITTGIMINLISRRIRSVNRMNTRRNNKRRGCRGRGIGRKQKCERKD